MDLGALGKAKGGSRVVPQDRRVFRCLCAKAQDSGAKGSAEVCVSQLSLQVLTEQGVGNCACLADTHSHGGWLDAEQMKAASVTGY